MGIAIAGEGAVVKQLKRFADRLQTEGAWYNPDLLLDVEGSNVSVRSQNSFTDLRSMIRVPLAAMPVLDDFDVSVSSEVFSVSPKDKAVSEAQRVTMVEMLDFYNELGKIAQWKAETPWLSLLPYPDVLDHIMSGRVQMPRLKELHRMGIDGEHDALICDTFIGSRKFNLSETNCKLMGREQKGGVKILLPIIDFFNHRMNAQGFKINAVPAPASMRIQSIPDPDTGELFVRYNVFDALDTYLYYGFVDRGVGYMSSVPCRLKIGNVTLSVRGGGGMSKSAKLPSAIKDLRLFLPALTKSDEGNFFANKLVIPGPRAPRALHRVLVVIMNTLGIPKTEQQNTMLQAEADILDQNETWWQELKEKVSVVPEENGVHMLVETGLQHIAQYRELQEGKAAS